jgi:hypothetical protein
MRTLIKIMAGVIIGLLAANALLTMVDPSGLYTYFVDLAKIKGLLVSPVPDGRSYILRSGLHVFGRWHASILPDGTRDVPDTNRSSDCTILVVGDSVAFGHGVQDHQTFTNLLSRRYPAVHFVLGAVTAYNAWDVQKSVKALPANGVLYLIISNDWETGWDASAMKEEPVPPALGLYIRVAMMRQYPFTPDITNALAVIERQRAEGVYLAGIEGDPLATAAGAYLIPGYHHTVSAFDNHPSPEGHHEIALALLPFVDQIIAEKCS